MVVDVNQLESREPLQGGSMTGLSFPSPEYNTIMDAVLDHSAIRDPRWILQFCLIYLGHPILFFGYLFIVGEIRIWSISTFTTVSTNVTRMNPWLFLAITLPLYVVWLMGEIHLLARVSSHFSLNKFLESTATWGATPLSFPGLLNFLTYITSGMEGNVFGFFFFFPMLLASLGYIVLWILQLKYACKQQDDLSF